MGALVNTQCFHEWHQRLRALRKLTVRAGGGALPDIPSISESWGKECPLLRYSRHNREYCQCSGSVADDDAKSSENGTRLCLGDQRREGKEANQSNERSGFMWVGGSSAELPCERSGESKRTEGLMTSCKVKVHTGPSVQPDMVTGIRRSVQVKLAILQ